VTSNAELRQRGYNVEVQSTSLGYIGLGSNLGDRQAYLACALELLAAVPGLGVLRTSRTYESPAWGYASAHRFLNAVAEISWAGAPQELLVHCRAIERQCGRQRTEDETQVHSAAAYADRTLDLDILWLEGVELLLPRLTLPHPLAQRRTFVLVPWCELASELMLHGRSLSAWLKLLPREEVESIVPFDP
jgi:2-amino-4-hydroxy-6-hydroxymethyldihydropteridine diphosphokinase